MTITTSEQLDKGVDSWNKWRDEYPHKTPYLRHVQKINEDLSTVNFRVAYLQDANFQGANLCNADLCAAILTGANLSDTNLKGAKYNKRTIWPKDFDPKIAGAILMDENIPPVDKKNLLETQFQIILNHEVEYWNNWRDSNPEIQTDLQSADLKGKVLINANFHCTNLIGADLSLCEMTNANLDSANLSDARLKYTGLHEANLKNTNLKGAILHDVDFSDAKYNQNTIWPNGFDFQNSGALLTE